MVVLQGIIISLIVVIIILLLTKKNIAEDFATNNCPVCYITQEQQDKNIEKKTLLKQQVYGKLIKKTKEVLERLNIPMFLSSGTCLGYLREGKIIDHDYDVDVGIFAKDYTPTMTTELAKAGIYLYRTLGDEATGMELSYIMTGTPLGKRAKIDIFLHYPSTDEQGNQKLSWYSYKAPLFKEKIQYRVNKFDIKEVPFLGFTVNVPSPVVNYIKDHY